MRATLVKFVVFAVAASVALVVLANTMSNQVAGATTRYAADFSSVSGLRVGDDVRAAGVKVGRVEEIGLRDGRTARVEFTLSDRQPLLTTTRLVVRYQNLLGQRYLSLVAGEQRGPRLAASAVVPKERTDPGFDLTALLNGFEPLFATLEPDDVNRLSGSIIAVMQGEGGTIEALLDETATLTTDLADKDEVIGEVLDHLTPVLLNLAEQDDEVASTVTSLRTLMTRLAEERSSIGDSIDGVSELARVTASLAEDARPALEKDVAELRTTARTFARNREVIGEAFRTLPSTSDAFARPMSSGSWLDIYICNMATVLEGAVVNVGPSDGPYSAVCR